MPPSNSTRAVALGAHRSSLVARTLKSRSPEGAPRSLLPAQGRGRGVTPEMPVAPAEQVSRDRSLASQCDLPGAAASLLEQQSGFVAALATMQKRR